MTSRLVKLEINHHAWIDKSFFVPNSHNKSILTPEDHHPPILATHRGCDTSSIRDTFINIVGNAKKRIFCCSFLLGGDTVTQFLVEAAQRLAGHVYVVTALNEELIGQGYEREEEFSNTTLQRNIKRFVVLTKSGVYVRGAADCHAKFLVADDNVALITSSNFDPNGLGENQQYASGEIGMVLKGSRAETLKTLFNYIWLSKCAFEAKPNPDIYRVTSRKPLSNKQLNSNYTKTGVIWTADDQNLILDVIVQNIKRARKKILLATYSFTSMKSNSHLLIDHLLEAINRGVIIELFMRLRTRDLDELVPLLKAGIDIKADLSNHAKYIVTDEENAALFTANFDGKYGLTNGIEVGVLLDENELRSLKKYHEACWAAATHKCILVNSREKLLSSIKNYEVNSDKFKVNTDDIEKANRIMKGAWLIASKKDSHWIAGDTESVLIESSLAESNRDDQVILANAIAHSNDRFSLGNWGGN